MPVKRHKADRLLTIKGNVWWFRMHMPAPVHRVIGGSPWVMMSIGADLAEAKKTRDVLERITEQQFAEVEAGKRLTLEIPGWGRSAISTALPPAERGAITQAALEAAEDDDERHLIITAAEDEVERMRPNQRKAFEDAMLGQVEVERHLEDYLRAARLSAKTANERRGLIMRCARWCGERGKKLHRVDRKVAGQYVGEIIDPMHTQTQKKHLIALRQYWMYLAMRGHVTPPPGVEIDKGWPWNDQQLQTKSTRVERGDRDNIERPFTHNEVAALLHTEFPLQPDWEDLMKDALQVSLLGGMRQAEVLTLMVEEIVISKGVIDIRQGKTPAAVREVPIHPALHAMLVRRTAGKGAKDMVFHELEGVPNPADTFGKRFKRWREAVGVAVNVDGQRRSLVNFHSARRWFARTAFTEGGQLSEVIGSVMGHTPSKKKVTYAVYIVTTSEAQRRACVESVNLPPPP